MFHLHRWEEVDRNYQPSDVSRAKYVPDEYLNRVLFGMTTVELRCVRCGLVRAVRYAGDSGVRR